MKWTGRQKETMEQLRKYSLPPGLRFGRAVLHLWETAVADDIRCYGNKKMLSRLARYHQLYPRFEEINPNAPDVHLIKLLCTNVNGRIGGWFEHVILHLLIDHLKIDEDRIEFQHHLEQLQNIEVDFLIRSAAKELPDVYLLAKTSLRERGKQWKEVGEHVAEMPRRDRPKVCGITLAETADHQMNPSKISSWLRGKTNSLPEIQLMSVYDEDSLVPLLQALDKKNWKSKAYEKPQSLLQRDQPSNGRVA